MNSLPKAGFRRFIPSIGPFCFGTSDKSSGVFSINLIRSQSFFLRNRRLLSYATVGYFIAQGLIFLGLVLWGLGLWGQAVYLDKSFHRIFPASDSIKDYKAHLNQLSQRAQASLDEVKAAVAIEKDKFRVAGKLAGIVRTIPIRTWITSIRVTAATRSMVIAAGFLVDMEDPDERPFKDWIEALKKDPGFSPGLKQIEQVSSSETRKGEADVSLFEIRAGW